ncbi:hypothetical protein EI71_01407 [Anaeroplasma bactoclasticum]|jgi:hypothetical protein|uniref:Uncharacterized protein n=1 Tax=Anaeroplasma bactoclasticum TaxID=2088 RepID=A0A397RN12_9MOLU|nr:hypothetical protein [Anaeroplasma bactoclasticum]RIA75513.1 hypothetical protein EI71_01407 [Anaeroplasma bactoclasticum]
MNPEEYLSFIKNYFNENSNILEDIINEYINSEAMKVNVEGFKEMMPSILYSLYCFLTSSDYVSSSIKEKVTSKENDFTALTNELLYIWTHGAIPVTISWERSSKEFNRKLLIPLRASLSDIMYGALSTMRSLMSEMVYLESGDYAFVSSIEYSDLDDYSYLASDYAAYAIYNLTEPRMCYGYMDAWVFLVEAKHIRILDDNKAKEPILLLDAEGYGIFEGNQDNVLLALGDPMAKPNDNTNPKEMLGVDFTKVDIEDIKANLKENFYLTQFRYEVTEE